MVYEQVSGELQNALARERKDVIESDLESVVVILGEESKCLIPLISNFDPLLRDFDKVLTDLARAEVACSEYREKHEQGEAHIKILKQQKKSIDLRTVELEALQQADLRRWNEQKKQLDRRIEDYEWKLENRETDLQRVSKVNSDLQKQLNNSSSQIQKIKTAKNITRKFNSAVRMVQSQKDTDATQKIIKKLEEDSNQYTDRFNTLDSENAALSRQLEEATDRIDELEQRGEMMSSEKRVWKVEKEDLLEESAHLRSQLKLLEGDLAKHHMATKNLQAQIRAVEAEVKTYEAESVRIADENQLLESQMNRMKNIMISEGMDLENYPELNIKLPDEYKVEEKIRAHEVKTSTPMKVMKADDHELSLQDELDIEGSLGSELKKQSSEMDTLEMKHTQLEQELMRIETEKNVLLQDVHRAEKTAAGKDKEISGLKEEMNMLSKKIMEQRSQLEAYEEQRGVMENEHLKMAEKIVRDTRSRRSFRKTHSTESEEVNFVDDNLFDENMLLMKEKQELFTKYTQLETKSLEVERKLKDQKSDAERKLKRLEEDYSAIMSSEHSLAEKLKDVQAKHDRLKCLYNLLQSEDNESEDPEELVFRLKYRRSEVETLLRDRTVMRTQIVSLQKMINMRNEEENRDHEEGIIGRVLSVLRRRNKGDKTVGRLGSLAARTTTGVIGKELGNSWVEQNNRRRKSLTMFRRSDSDYLINTTTHSSIHTTNTIEELKELSAVPRKISNGWTYLPTGIFSAGLPPIVPTYSKLLMIDERPQRVVCSTFVPSWPLPRSSGVRIMLEKQERSNSKESRSSFEGRDSSSKSKESSSRGSTRSLESKDSVRSSKSMDGKSNFPLIEEAVMGSDDVALGMLCMSTFKPLACMALNTRTLGDVSNQAEDRMSAALFSQDVLRNSIRRNQASVTQTYGEPSVAEYVNEIDTETAKVEGLGRRGDEEADEDAEVRRQLFKQTKDAFLRRPVSSFKHKVSDYSRSLYPFLWLVTSTDDSKLSFLHVVNLNFPARVSRTQFLCEGKVNTLAVVKNKADDPEEEIRAKKVLFGKQQTGDGCSCWMGTSDGRLFILGITEPYTQVYTHQLSGGVLQILHVEPHVFVSLHNGALVVYTRDKEGAWDMDNYQLIVVDITGKKVRRISAIDDKLWCGTGPAVAICNTLNYRIDEKINVVLDESESIREIVHVADTVWMCLSKSTKIVVVASQTKRVLRVISLKGYLLRTGLRHGLDLQQSDLYITTLFYDGSLVWIGTNIGVVLAVRFPVEDPGLGAPVRTSKLSSADDELCFHNGDVTNGGISHDEKVKYDSRADDQKTNRMQSDQINAKDENTRLDGQSLQYHAPANDSYQIKTSICSNEAKNGNFSASDTPLNKETTFDYLDNSESTIAESGTHAEKSAAKKTCSVASNISDENEMEAMLASFDIDSLAAKRVQNISEEHILFSIYGNQGPVNCFCNVEGDDELPSLLCGSGIGFDDYEVKGLKSARRKDCINANSPDDPRLLAQLLIWSYCK